MCNKYVWISEIIVWKSIAIELMVKQSTMFTSVLTKDGVKPDANPRPVQHWRLWGYTTPECVIRYVYKARTPNLLPSTLYILANFVFDCYLLPTVWIGSYRSIYLFATMPFFILSVFVTLYSTAWPSFLFVSIRYDWEKDVNYILYP